MKVLFIGGTGIISSGCAQLALDRGFDLFILNRGKSHTHNRLEPETESHATTARHTPNARASHPRTQAAARAQRHRRPAAAARRARELDPQPPGESPMRGTPVLDRGSPLP